MTNSSDYQDIKKILLEMYECLDLILDNRTTMSNVQKIAALERISLYSGEVYDLLTWDEQITMCAEHPYFLEYNRNRLDSRQKTAVSIVL